MRWSRYERDLVGARTRYIAASERLERALAAWRAAAVPVEVADDEIPPWTPRQLAATARLAAALADLLERRRLWEEMLQELGHQR